MTTKLDLHPAAREVTRLLGGITDDQLAGTDARATGRTSRRSSTTSWGSRSRSGMLRRSPAARTRRAASAVAENLHPDWRSVLPVRLDELAAAWDDPAAWEGTTWAGGVEMPGALMATVALDELVLHGWDLAERPASRSTSTRRAPRRCSQFTAASAAPGQEAMREGLFGPVVDVPADASPFDRALGFSGRDPGWTPPTTDPERPATAGSVHDCRQPVRASPDVNASAARRTASARCRGCDPARVIARRPRSSSSTTSRSSWRSARPATSWPTCSRRVTSQLGLGASPSRRSQSAGRGSTSPGSRPRTTPTTGRSGSRRWCRWSA